LLSFPFRRSILVCILFAVNDFSELYQSDSNGACALQYFIQQQWFQTLHLQAVLLLPYAAKARSHPIEMASETAFACVTIDEKQHSVEKPRPQRQTRESKTTTSSGPPCYYTPKVVGFDVFGT
jgi:hypothetical protein